MTFVFPTLIIINMVKITLAVAKHNQKDEILKIKSPVAY